jgi:hypothetical protein
MLISLAQLKNPISSGHLEELVGQRSAQRVDQVGEHHRHQDVCDPLVNRCACGETTTQKSEKDYYVRIIEVLVFRDRLGRHLVGLNVRRGTTLKVLVLACLTRGLVR